ncbi:hypothetical Protein YC6258_00143 [Gynuella sunshinyii YC6258]|uniref:Uncharacterized protein n=1 Tax=Gynuella sunshinyii YC6258 TaxID=1445510 RepID=A0A0C5VPL9_9GAMM|nr:hypothetical Protein YC6258_00143 [Gynuella sunshinyii YC6258]
MGVYHQALFASFLGDLLIFLDLNFLKIAATVILMSSH